MIGMLVTGTVVASAAFLAWKMVPAYTEYMRIKRVTTELVKEGTNAGDIKSRFSAMAASNNIHTITEHDLIILQSGGSATINASYEVVVPLISSVNVLMTFDVDTSTKTGKSGGEL